MTIVVQMDFNWWSARTAFIQMLRDLRSEDIAELLAVRGGFDPVRIDSEMARADAKLWLAYPDGSSTPAAAFGFHRMTPT